MSFFRTNISPFPEEYRQSQAVDVGGAFRNYLKGQTGSGLTDAQVAQNEFQERMANTQYQRGVEDMKAAGLNPALLYGQGSSPAPSPSGASVGTPNFSFQEVVSALTLPKQIEQMQANIELAKSSADKNRADADLIRQNKDFDAKLFDLRKRGQELSNDLTSETIENTKELRTEIQENITLLRKKQLTEDEVKALTEAQKNLTNMQEREIAVLLPYKQRELDARTAQERAAAVFSTVQAGIQAGLWRMGYFDKQFEELQESIRQRATSADYQEVQKGIQELRLRMANGEFIDTSSLKWWQIAQRIDANATNNFYKFMTTMSIAVNGSPLGAGATVVGTAMAK